MHKQCIHIFRAQSEIQTSPLISDSSILISNVLKEPFLRNIFPPSPLWYGDKAQKRVKVIQNLCSSQLLEQPLPTEVTIASFLVEVYTLWEWPLEAHPRKKNPAYQACILHFVLMIQNTTATATYKRRHFIGLMLCFQGLEILKACTAPFLIWHQSTECSRIVWKPQSSLPVTYLLQQGHTS